MVEGTEFTLPPDYVGWYSSYLTIPASVTFIYAKWTSIYGCIEKMRQNIFQEINAFT